MTERHEPLGDLTVHWREAPARTTVPVVYLHGVPTDGGDWAPFLERTGGFAPDLPGFGRSDKPLHFDYSIDGYARFLREWLDSVGVERYSLVVHDWGAVGLALAQQQPERVERLVVMDAVPLLPGYRWHRVARLWRMPLIGEMAMGFTFKRTLRNLGGVPDLDRVWPHFDHGTQRAILKLYRSAPASVLDAAGARLDRIGAPALVVWGADDHYLPLEFAHAYAERLGGDAGVEIVEGAGHWPWVQRPQIIEQVTAFLSG